jgi:RNase P/RNase MRP subunit POP5
MKIKKSARERKRYLLVSGGTRNEINKVIKDYVGTYGWNRASPKFLGKLKVKVGNIVLSVNRKELDKIKEGINLGKGLKVLRVSGTLKGLGVR